MAEKKGGYGVVQWKERLEATRCNFLMDCRLQRTWTSDYYPSIAMPEVRSHTVSAFLVENQDQKMKDY